MLQSYRYINQVIEKIPSLLITKNQTQILREANATQYID